MAIFGSNSPRRLFDARFDYYLKLGSLAAEAERAIILRLIDGVPQNYLAMIGRGWRAELTAYDRSEPMILLWHEAIEGLIKDKEYMKQLHLKADFYRTLWFDLPESERKTRSRNDWVTKHLSRHSAQQADKSYQADGKPPVPQELGFIYSAFEKREARETMFKQGALQSYIEIVQPASAELLRKLAAEKKLTEEAEEQAKLQEATEAADRDRDGGDKVLELGRQYVQTPAIAEEKKTPHVWEWEKKDGLVGGSADVEAPVRRRRYSILGQKGPAGLMSLLPRSAGRRHSFD